MQRGLCWDSPWAASLTTLKTWYWLGSGFCLSTVYFAAVEQLCVDVQTGPGRAGGCLSSALWDGSSEGFPHPAAAPWPSAGKFARGILCPTAHCHAGTSTPPRIHMIPCWLTGLPLNPKAAHEGELIIETNEIELFFFQPWLQPSTKPLCLPRRQLLLEE